jgi:hypothetical protein
MFFARFMVFKEKIKLLNRAKRFTAIFGPLREPGPLRSMDCGSIIIKFKVFL